MKSSKAVLVFSVGIALGLAVDWVRNSSKMAAHERESAALRAALQEAQKAQQNAASQRDRLMDETDRLRQQSEEVHRLRAEVSRLKREAEEHQKVVEQASRSLKKTPEATAPLPDKLKTSEGNLSIESAPLAIQSALLRETGGGLLRGALGSFTDKNGRTGYGFKGQMSDGKAIAMRLDENGSVLEKSFDIAAETVPPNIQEQAAQVLGNAAISGAREIQDGQDVRYELTAKGPNSGMQVSLRSDGTILSYSAKFQSPDKEQSGQKIRK